MTAMGNSERVWYRYAVAIRDRLYPARLDLGWLPAAWLLYLGFLFVPVVLGSLDDRALLVTLASIPVFLVLYLGSLRLRSRTLLFVCTLAMAGLAFAVTPFNAFANTYMVYAASMAAFIGSLRVVMPTVLVLLGLYVLQSWLIGTHLFSPLITVLVGIPVCLSNHQWLQNRRKEAALRLSNDEVRRLAQVAERERIGRDLHDLLGHTLTLVTVKAGLARKLIDRDPKAAQAEIAEVERVARDALAQVRRAVTGIRAATLRPELASARLLLESAGIEFQYSVADVDLAPAQETALALVLREGVTNAHRHAAATRVEASVRRDGDQAVLTLIDDGRGGATISGNGLSGMDERLRALGGQLRVESPSGQGTRLVASLPLPPIARNDGADGTVTPLRRSAA